MSSVLTAFGTVTLTIPAGESVAVFTQGGCAVYQFGGAPTSPNYPAVPALVGRVANGQTVFGPYANGATIQLQNTAGLNVLYEVGVSPVVKQSRLLSPVQIAPTALNATGDLTPALCLAALVTSSTAAAVVATLSVASVWELASDWNANDTLQWSVVNTGPNTFTVTSPDATHTVVGAGAVATGTSGTFRTRRVSATSFITYRIA